MNYNPLNIINMMIIRYCKLTDKPVRYCSANSFAKKHLVNNMCSHRSMEVLLPAL